jgi:diphthine-ammonia ligase
VVHSDHDFATVAYLRIKGAHLVPKEVMGSYEVAIPDALDDGASFEQPDPLLSLGQTAVESYPNDLPIGICRAKKVSKWIYIANVDGLCGSDQSLDQEVEECFINLSRKSYNQK